MEFKSLNIQGFTNTQGDILGANTEFTYYLLDIPELQKINTNPIVIVFDILASVVIVGSTTPSYVGKHTSRKIKATLTRTSAGEFSLHTSFDAIHIDTETEDAQTNLEIRDKRLYIKFTGTTYGHTFSCSGDVRYAVVYANPENKKQTQRKSLTSVVEDMAPTSGIIVKHNDTTDRDDADTHPADSITNTPYGTISDTNVQDAINYLDDQVSGIVVITDHSGLTGLSDAGSHPATAISFDNGDSGLVAIDVQEAIDEVEDRVNSLEVVSTQFTNIVSASKEPTGFENRTTSTLTYDSGTRQFTITPNFLGALSTCYYWIKGVRYHLTAAVTSVAHADTSDTYFFYFNASNVATVSHDFWDFSVTCPIAFVLYDTVPTPSQGVLCDERHGMVMDWATHTHLHFSKGAFVRSGFGIGSYVLNSSTVDDKKPKFDEGVLCDEDNTFTHSDSYAQELLAADRRYAMFYRVGAAGTWSWSKNELFPVLWQSLVSYNPYYNQYALGVWDLTEITLPQNWFNIYACAVNSVDRYYKIVFFVGQQVYSSLAAAEEESILSFDWGDVPFQEIAPLYQITLRRGSFGGAGNPNIQISAVQKIIGVSITLSGLLASNHASLAGRDLPNSHPATAVSYDISTGTSDLFSSDVQGAIEELSEFSERSAQTGTITRDIDGNIETIVRTMGIGVETTTITRVAGIITTITKAYTDLSTTYTRTKTLTRDVDDNITGWTIL